MEIAPVKSLSELRDVLTKSEKTYLLIYKEGSDQSDCAMEHFKKASESISGITLLAVNVAEVRDIHEHYEIRSAPTLLEFEKEELKNAIKGCHKWEFFKALLEDAVFHAQNRKEGKVPKQVRVYSTPACTWCNTLKSYLRQHKVRFTDIDVSRDQNAAREMVNRSGQQGVPQTLINGQLVIGFDKKKINELLEITT